MFLSGAQKAKLSFVRKQAQTNLGIKQPSIPKLSQPMAALPSTPPMVSNPMQGDSGFAKTLKTLRNY